METTQVVPVSVTEKRAEMIRGFLADQEPGAGVRLRVVGGGCSGMSYDMAIEPSAAEGDHVIQDKGVNIFVDPKSYIYVFGCQIDYVETMMGGGFSVNNPNATSTCGCAHSFHT